MTTTCLITKTSSNPSARSVGISGCKIEYSGDRVIKTSPSVFYNERLRNQIEKQRYFYHTFKIQGIHVPYIYEFRDEWDYRQELFSANMQKINGGSWFEFLNYSDVSEINLFYKTISLYFEVIAAKSTNTYSNLEAERLILAKLRSLKFKSKYPEFIEYLIKQAKVSDLSLPTSFCHGDLTLSNMIFSRNELYLIDFLDCFISSYYMDIIKLRQDIHYGWCLKFNASNSIRLKCIFENLDEKLSNDFHSEIKSNAFHFLEAINILRIEPYIDQSKSHIIEEMLLKTKKYEEFNNSNLR